MIPPIASVLLIAELASAQPKAPSPQQLREIEDALDRAEQSLTAFQDQRKKMRPVEDALFVSRDKDDQPTRSLTQEELARLSPHQRELYYAGTRTEAALIKSVFETHRRAIELTSTYFGIAPRPDATPVLRLPSPKDGHSYWRPMFSDRRLSLVGGDRERLETPGEMLDRPAFLRYNDGVVVVRRGAFQYPGYLALCLYHECSHLERSIVTGAQPTNDPEEEVRVRQAMLPFLVSKFDLHPRDWMIEVLNLEVQHTLREIWAERIRQGENPKDRYSNFPYALNPAQMDDVKSRVEGALAALLSAAKDGHLVPGELDRIRPRFGVLFLQAMTSPQVDLFLQDWSAIRTRWLSDAAEQRKVVDGADFTDFLSRLSSQGIAAAKDLALQGFRRRRADEQQAWERDRPDREAREAEHWKELERHWAVERKARDTQWAYLKTMAGLACSKPDELAEQAARSAVISVNIETFILGSYIAWEALDPCERFVLRSVEHSLWRGDRPTTKQLVAWGTQYRDEHPSLLKRLTTTLSDFTRVKGIADAWSNQERVHKREVVADVSAWTTS